MVADKRKKKLIYITKFCLFFSYFDSKLIPLIAEKFNKQRKNPLRNIGNVKGRFILWQVFSCGKSVSLKSQYFYLVHFLDNFCTAFYILCFCWLLLLYCIWLISNLCASHLMHQFVSWLTSCYYCVIVFVITNYAVLLDNNLISISFFSLSFLFLRIQFNIYMHYLYSM